MKRMTFFIEGNYFKEISKSIRRSGIILYHLKRHQAKLEEIINIIKYPHNAHNDYANFVLNKLDKTKINFRSNRQAYIVSSIYISKDDYPFADGLYSLKSRIERGFIITEIIRNVFNQESILNPDILNKTATKGNLKPEEKKVPEEKPEEKPDEKKQISNSDDIEINQDILDDLMQF